MTLIRHIGQAQGLSKFVQGCFFVRFKSWFFEIGRLACIVLVPLWFIVVAQSGKNSFSQLQVVVHDSDSVYGQQGWANLVHKFSRLLHCCSFFHK